MKKLVFILLIAGLSVATQAQLYKTSYTLMDSTAIAADSVNIGPLSFDYTWALPVQTWSLDDTDAQLVRYGGAVSTGPWVAIDTLTLSNATGVQALTGNHLYYLYYKHKIILNSVTSGGIEIKMIRFK